MNWVDELTPEQRARWTDITREPFHLFQTVGEELSAPDSFWLSRTLAERMEYLEHTRWVVYGEEAMRAPMVRCYGWRKINADDYDPKNVVHFCPMTPEQITQANAELGAKSDLDVVKWAVAQANGRAIFSTTPYLDIQASDHCHL